LLIISVDIPRVTVMYSIHSITQIKSFSKQVQKKFYHKKILNI
jgi:hypothetical protein